MTHPKRIALALTVLTTTAGTAAAQTPAPAEPVPTVAAPFKMPDLSDRSAFRFDLGITRISVDEADEDETVTSTVGIASVHVVAAPGFVIMGRLPLTYAHSSDADDTTEFDPGNIGVGARVTRRSGDVRFGGTVMLHLPTAPQFTLFGDDDDDGVGALVAAISQFDSFADFSAETTTVRVGGDLRVDRGNVFAQGQLGVEHYMNDDADEALDLVRIGVAAGVQATPRLAIVGELTTISTVLEDDDELEEGDELFHWLDVGVRYDTGKAMLGARVYMPLDEPLDDDVDIFGVGFDATIPF